MNAPASQEQVKLWRLPELGLLELMHATYVTQTFPRHTHEGFGVGVIERGALGFFYRGENVVASPGAISLVNPGEVHTGHAAEESGWTYRMFYFNAPLLQEAACQIAGRPKDIPFFKAGVIRDHDLAGSIHCLHVRLEETGKSTLEKESRLLWMLTHLITRHADAPPPLKTVGRERTRVKRVREYMEAHFHQDISLNRLASLANLSPFHFVRVFRKELGLPPHTYLTQVRVNRAKALLAKGRKIADTALQTGFVDQSHLTRHFKRITGVTPGQYRKIVQDL
ncbi:MAG: AraC family transcriptional regulator [Thermodesulfobacteriota bacterium]|nr:AraC family transcriptional regulator [Thermodesulfobacteriota bacterium]